MRTPLEIWLNDHKKVIEQADRLVELLAPDDIQAQIADPGNKELRDGLIACLQAFVDITEKHYRDEETHLLPAIVKYLDRNRPEIKQALGCFAREHDQMFEYSERIKILLPLLQSDEKISNSDAAEILRTSYASQTLIRNHSAMEEKEIYPLVTKLPMKVVAEIFEAIEADFDMNIDHLIKPLYGRESGKERIDKREEKIDGGEEKKEYKYGQDGMDFYRSEDGDARGPEN
jgi:hemerythrin-like domain-containing protein